jgi:hypothetical protein
MTYQFVIVRETCPRESGELADSQHFPDERGDVVTDYLQHGRPRIDRNNGTLERDGFSSQLVETRQKNHGVGGSIPPLAPLDPELNAVYRWICEGA